MAVHRYVNSAFWDSDEYTHSLEPMEKLAFLYFLTNSKTTIAGIYEIPWGTILHETKIPEDELTQIMAKFQADGKVCRVRSWIVMPNWPKHQRWQQRVKIRTGIISALQELPAYVFDELEDMGYDFPLESVDGTIIASKARRGISGTKRKRLIQEAGGQCRRCAATGKLLIHHKIPVEEGGTNHDDNLEVLCESCHIKVHISHKDQTTENGTPVHISHKDQENIHISHKDQDNPVHISHNDWIPVAKSPQLSESESESESEQEKESEDFSLVSKIPFPSADPQPEHFRIANEYARQHFKHTTVQWRPLEEHYAKAADVARQLDGNIDLACKAASAYFADPWWFTTGDNGTKTKKPSFSFGGFAAHAVEIASVICKPKPPPFVIPEEAPQ